LKKYIYTTIFFLLALVVFGIYIEPKSDKIASQPQASPQQSTLVSIYKDVQWGANVQKHLIILTTDFNNISNATNNSNYAELATYTQYTIDHTQKAIEENDQYKVSLKLQEAQKEWRMALQDYNSAGQFLLQGANETKSGNERFVNFKHAATLGNYGTSHLKRMSESLGINLSLNLN
jgi:hypothetical protein